MSRFSSIVNTDTVSSLGIDMSLWGDEEQSQLIETMMLACKENPHWTEEQIKEECQDQVDLIFFNWFQETLARLVTKSQGWPTLEDAYEEFKKTTLKNFLETLQEHQDYQDFCEECYTDLREMWNICSTGMRDEYEKMKEKGWSIPQYRMWLDKEVAKKGMY